MLFAGPTPLFLFWAPHTVHSPLQVHPKYLHMFDGIGPTDNRNHARQICPCHACPTRSLWLFGRWFQLESGGCWGRLDHAMVKLLDDAVENVTSAMRAESMWDQTLFVMCESPPILPCLLSQQGLN